MALTGVQVMKLRSMAHKLDPAVTVGKAGVTDGLVKQVEDALEAHELVKCSVMPNIGMTASEAAAALCERLGAETVQVIGRKFSLYRKTRRKDVESIVLPQA